MLPWSRLILDLCSVHNSEARSLNWASWVLLRKWKWHFPNRLVTFPKYKCRGKRHGFPLSVQTTSPSSPIAQHNFLIFSGVVSRLIRLRALPLKKQQVLSVLLCHCTPLFTPSCSIQHNTIMQSIPFIKTYFICSANRISQIGSKKRKEKGFNLPTLSLMKTSWWREEKKQLCNRRKQQIQHLKLLPGSKSVWHSAPGGNKYRI